MAVSGAAGDAAGGGRRPRLRCELVAAASGARHATCARLLPAGGASSPGGGASAVAVARDWGLELLDGDANTLWSEQFSESIVSIVALPGPSESGAEAAHAQDALLVLLAGGGSVVLWFELRPDGAILGRQIASTPPVTDVDVASRASATGVRTVTSEAYEVGGGGSGDWIVAATAPGRTTRDPSALTLVRAVWSDGTTSAASAPALRIHAECACVRLAHALSLPGDCQIRVHALHFLSSVPGSDRPDCAGQHQLSVLYTPLIDAGARHLAATALALPPRGVSGAALRPGGWTLEHVNPTTSLAVASLDGRKDGVTLISSEDAMLLPERQGTLRFGEHDALRGVPLAAALLPADGAHCRACAIADAAGGLHVLEAQCSAPESAATSGRASLEVELSLTRVNLPAPLPRASAMAAMPLAPRDIETRAARAALVLCSDVGPTLAIRLERSAGGGKWIAAAADGPWGSPLHELGPSIAAPCTPVGVPGPVGGERQLVVLSGHHPRTALGRAFLGCALSTRAIAAPEDVTGGAPARELLWVPDAPAAMRSASDQTSGYLLCSMDGSQPSTHALRLGTRDGESGEAAQPHWAQLPGLKEDEGTLAAARVDSACWVQVTQSCAAAVVADGVRREWAADGDALLQMADAKGSALVAASRSKLYALECLEETASSAREVQQSRACELGGGELCALALCEWRRAQYVVLSAGWQDRTVRVRSWPALTELCTFDCGAHAAACGLGAPSAALAAPIPRSLALARGVLLVGTADGRVIAASTKDEASEFELVCDDGDADSTGPPEGAIASVCIFTVGHGEARVYPMQGGSGDGKTPADPGMQPLAAVACDSSAVLHISSGGTLSVMRLACLDVDAHLDVATGGSEGHSASRKHIGEADRLRGVCWATHALAFTGQYAARGEAGGGEDAAVLADSPEVAWIDADGAVRIGTCDTSRRLRLISRTLLGGGSPAGVSGHCLTHLEQSRLVAAVLESPSGRHSRLLLAHDVNLEDVLEVPLEGDHRPTAVSSAMLPVAATVSVKGQDGPRGDAVPVKSVVAGELKEFLLIASTTLRPVPGAPADDEFAPTYCQGLLTVMEVAAVRDHANAKDTIRAIVHGTIELDSVPFAMRSIGRMDCIGAATDAQKDIANAHAAPHCAVCADEAELSHLPTADEGGLVVVGTSSGVELVRIMVDTTGAASLAVLSQSIAAVANLAGEAEDARSSAATDASTRSKPCEKHAPSVAPATWLGRVSYERLGRERSCEAGAPIYALSEPTAAPGRAPIVVAREALGGALSVLRISGGRRPASVLDGSCGDGVGLTPPRASACPLRRMCIEGQDSASHDGATKWSSRAGIALPADGARYVLSVGGRAPHVATLLVRDLEAEHEHEQVEAMEALRAFESFAAPQNDNNNNANMWDAEDDAQDAAAVAAEVAAAAAAAGIEGAVPAVPVGHVQAKRPLPEAVATCVLELPMRVAAIVGGRLGMPPAAYAGARGQSAQAGSAEAYVLGSLGEVARVSFDDMLFPR